MVPGVDVARGIVLDGRYRIEDVLGQGGMATVYRAHDEVLERDVAIKLFPPTPDADEVLRHRSEMRVLAQLSHPGLVTLHDAGSAYAGGPMQQTYLVMELVPGPTLADLLATGPMPARHVARAGKQLAEALCTVHDAGVVHRDIKPANVLLVERRAVEEADDATLVTGPLVKLADFGIARFSDGARLTLTGTTLGTATYLSPEQAAGTTVGPPTDVYALGLVLLECLTGVRAFTGTVVEVAAARLNTSPAIPTTVGREWAELLAAMTRRDPQERISMAQAAARLDDMVRGATRASTPGTSAGPGVHEPDHVADGTDGRAAAQDVSTAAMELAPVRDAEPAATTRRYRPADVLARAAGAAPPVDADDAEHAEPVPDHAGPVPGRARGPRAGALGAVAVLVLLVVAAAVYLSRPPAPAVDPSPPSYPEVDGPLGDALDDLIESVEP